MKPQSEKLSAMLDVVSVAAVAIGALAMSMSHHGLVLACTVGLLVIALARCLSERAGR